jgi:hypothetical protein
MASLLEHRLKDDTLVREGDGIVAHCVCGWSSRPHFTSMSASADFAEHKEQGDRYNADIMKRIGEAMQYDDPRCKTYRG